MEYEPCAVAPDAHLPGGAYAIHLNGEPLLSGIGIEVLRGVTLVEHLSQDLFSEDLEVALAQQGCVVHLHNDIPKEGARLVRVSPELQFKFQPTASRKTPSPPGHLSTPPQAVWLNWVAHNVDAGEEAPDILAQLRREHPQTLAIMADSVVELFWVSRLLRVGATEGRCWRALIPLASPPTVGRCRRRSRPSTWASPSVLAS